LNDDKFKYFSTQISKGATLSIKTIGPIIGSHFIELTFDGIKSDNTCKLGFKLSRDVFIEKQNNEKEKK